MRKKQKQKKVIKHFQNKKDTCSFGVEEKSNSCPSLSLENVLGVLNWK